MPDLDALWLWERPAHTIEAGEVTLKRRSASDVDAVTHSARASFTHLRQWMPWAQEPIASEGMADFAAQSERDWEAGAAFQYAIWAGSPPAVIGCCGLHNRVGTGALEIGYWVHVDHVGRGIATAAAKALTSAAFALGGVQQVEIRCDAANLSSAAVARKLGYRLDRVEERPPSTPGETSQHQIWVMDRP